jgi:5'-nucleotidase
MFILLTNDDGIQSEGLLKLREALTGVGEVLVIAPERDWSVASHAKSIHKPLRVYPVDLGEGQAFATDGTPTDCVALGLLGLTGRRPELVVAGINKGPNLGHDIIYSGTVAAAMEAAISGLPALAVSLGSYSDWNFDFAARFTARLVEIIMARQPQPGILFNVNIPSLPGKDIRGVEITRLGRRIYRDVLMGFKEQGREEHYWIGGEVPLGIEEEGTDVKALAEDKISITPIHMDLTHHGLVSHLQTWGLEVDLARALAEGH